MRRRPADPLRALAALLFLAASGCGQPSDEPNETAASGTFAAAGSWRAVLESPGGELPFTLRIDRAVEDGTSEDGAEAGPPAVIVNGEEEAPIGRVVSDGDRLELHFDVYDAEIVAALSADRSRLTGQWRKTIPGGDSTLPFSAVRGDDRRFLPLAETDLPPGGQGLVSIAGVWAVTFRENGDGEPEPARAELRQEGTYVEGTILTPTGDYRYLDGRYEEGLLRLSTFDGAHAFLFEARAGGDGSLTGDFWSRDSYHATWTAVRDDAAPLPDAWAEVGLTNDEGRLDFTFPDLDGEPVSLDDPRFDGKVVLVNVFGTWCPNCNDEAPLLARWHREYRDRGLEVVGLAYEFTGDLERDGEQVRRFAERYGVEYPLLLAGTSDKAEAAATLPDLTAVIAYPTTIFVGRDGTVRRIHSGFAGPGTGVHHERLVAEHTRQIEELLAEEAG